MSAEELTRAEIEKLLIHADLLAAYGDIRNTATEAELWCGCKDAVPLLRGAAATLAARDRRVEELEALLHRALVVAGNAAAHWHAIEGVEIKGSKCPGCAAEEESKAALEDIRVALAAERKDES